MENISDSELAAILGVELANGDRGAVLPQP
jgi:hypothetical protein